MSNESFAEPGKPWAPGKKRSSPDPGNSVSNAPKAAHNAASSSPTVPLSITHPSHLNCPNSLNCLPDTTEKPKHILPVLVRCAILGSPGQKLTLREIYSAIEEKFSYYRTALPGWKDSIRHNLSLNRMFVKVPRPGKESGYGSYWTVDLDVPPGPKRTRKRRKPKHGTSQSDTAGPSADGHGFTDVTAVSSVRFVANNSLSAVSRSNSEFEQEEDQADVLLSDYGSEEGGSAVPNIDEGSETPAIVLRTTRNEPPGRIIIRLQEELSESQRQFSIASAFALRISEQLEDARESANHVETELREARNQLEDEIVARVSAERRLEEEERVRKEMETKLDVLLQKGGPNTKLFEAIRSIQDISKRALEG